MYFVSHGNWNVCQQIPKVFGSNVPYKFLTFVKLWHVKKEQEVELISLYGQQILSADFPIVTNSLHSIFQKISAKYPHFKHHSLSFFQVKMVLPIHHSNNPMSSFPWHNCHLFIYSTIIISSHRLLKRYVFEP